MSQVAILRIKGLLADYGPYLAVGLALLGLLLGAIGGWQYTHPPTTQISETTHSQTIRSTLHTNVTTTGNTALYRSGTRLTDQPMYLLDSATAVTLRWRTSVPNNSATHVVQDVALVYKVSHDGGEFWRESQSLIHEETTTQTGRVDTPATLDMTEIKDRRAALQSEVGTAGAVDVFLHVTVSYNTSRYSGTLSETVPITLTNTWYRFESEPLSRTHRESTTYTKPLPTRDSGLWLALIGASVLCLLGGAVIAGVFYRGIDRSQTELRLQQIRYDSWISAGELTAEVDGPTVAMESLEGLVDVAIDTNNRVIYDQTRNFYAVLKDDIVYQYRPSEDSTSSTDRKT